MTTAYQVILLGGSFPGNTRSEYEKHPHVVYIQAEVLDVFVLWSSTSNSNKREGISLYGVLLFCLLV